MEAPRQFYTTNDLASLEEMNSRHLNPLNGTKRRVDVITHPQGGQWAVELPAHYVVNLERVLSGEEAQAIRHQLKDEATMRAEGWDI